MRAILPVVLAVVLCLNSFAATNTTIFLKDQTANFSADSDKSQWHIKTKQNQNGIVQRVYTKVGTNVLDLTGKAAVFWMGKSEQSPDGVVLTGVVANSYIDFTFTSAFLYKQLSSWYSAIRVTDPGDSTFQVSQPSGLITIKNAPEIDGGDIDTSRRIDMQNRTFENGGDGPAIGDGSTITWTTNASGQIVLVASASVVSNYIENLFSTNGGFLVGTGDGTYQEETGATARASLGLGSAALSNAAAFAAAGTLFAGPGTTGLVAAAAGDTNKYLKGDGTYGTPAGAGDIESVTNATPTYLQVTGGDSGDVGVGLTGVTSVASASNSMLATAKMVMDTGAAEGWGEDTTYTGGTNIDVVGTVINLDAAGVAGIAAATNAQARVAVVETNTVTKGDTNGWIVTDNQTFQEVCNEGNGSTNIGASTIVGVTTLDSGADFNVVQGPTNQTKAIQIAPAGADAVADRGAAGPVIYMFPNNYDGPEAEDGDLHLRSGAHGNSGEIEIWGTVNFKDNISTNVRGIYLRNVSSNTYCVITPDYFEFGANTFRIENDGDVIATNTTSAFGILTATDGSGILLLNASNLGSGTVGLARLPSAVVTNNETGLTLGGDFTSTGTLDGYEASELLDNTVRGAGLGLVTSGTNLAINVTNDWVSGYVLKSETAGTNWYWEADAADGVRDPDPIAFSLGPPTNGWASDSFPLSCVGTAGVDVVEIRMYAVGATGVVCNIEERTNPNVTGTDILTADTYVTTGGVTVTSFGNTNLAAYSWLVFTTPASAESGTVAAVTGIIVVE